MNVCTVSAAKMPSVGRCGSECERGRPCGVGEGLFTDGGGRAAAAAAAAAPSPAPAATSKVAAAVEVYEAVGDDDDVTTARGDGSARTLGRARMRRDALAGAAIAAASRETGAGSPPDDDIPELVGREWSGKEVVVGSGVGSREWCRVVGTLPSAV